MGYIKKLKRMRNTIVTRTNYELNAIEKNKLLMDYLWEHYVHGVALIEYNQYEFYKKKQRERREYVCYREFNKIIEIANKKEDYKYFDNKALFNKTFSEFMGRKWINTAEDDYEQFCELCSTNKELFVKPIDGMCGRGAYMLEIGNEMDTRTAYKRLNSEKAIVEEVVIQHNELAKFNASSVNTLRIVTMLCADDTVKIMAAVVRLGREGQVVDNFHNYGIVALVDNVTGVVKTTGVDRDFKRYVVHPDSGKVIPGFKIPSWNNIVSTIKKAAHYVPTIRYVGWDIAVGKNGEVIMVEGNKSADHDVTQVADQVGKWRKYKPIIEELVKCK